MRYFKFLFALIFVFSFTSCTITEKMIINDNGSGKFAYDIDASKMMSMFGSAIKNQENNTKKSKKNKKNKKELKDLKVVDSTFTFKEMFASKKDSIAQLPIEEQEKIKKMEKFSVRMVMNEEEGIMKYSMFTDFNTTAELQDVMSPIESMKSLSPKGNKVGMGMESNNMELGSSTSFFYDGKSFKKMVAKKDKVKQDDSEKTEEEKVIEKSAKESMEMIYEQSGFKIVYQFPKAVKKVSIQNALYSEDRKTITIEYPLKEYIENPDNLNFEVEFE
jgi:hypothetical protein